MANYSLGVRVAWGAFSVGPVAEIRTAALANARLTELSASNGEQNFAPALALGRPAAIGALPVTLWQFQPEDQADQPALTQIASQWLTPPTQPTSLFRRTTVKADIGMAFFWCSPKGILIPPASSLVLWNFTAAGTAAVGLLEIGAAIRE